MLQGHIAALHTIGCHGQQGRMIDEGIHVSSLPHQNCPSQWAHVIKRTDKG